MKFTPDQLVYGVMVLIFIIATGFMIYTDPPSKQ